ncbi:DUF7691 family protein [Nocardia fluminea]|uniref:DUF7691 family protein n=1 Tax=Nocardia fluminea TaxID=134984 RepID=UPI003F4E4455
MRVASLWPRPRTSPDRCFSFSNRGHAGPPAEIPFHIPGSLEGYPEVGHLALSRAKAVADAYRAVIDKIDQDFVDDLTTLVEKLEFEHETWLSRQGRDPSWFVADTLFFSTD